MSKFYIAPELEDTFREPTLFKDIDALQGEVVRAVEARRTLHTWINGQHYFVKIHFGVGWGEILKNLLQGRLPVLGAGNEWHALARLHEAGVPTMTGVAFVSEGKNPAKQRSAIMTRALENKISLEDYMAGDPVTKRKLIYTVATMVRDMHAAGINHRDCYLCHFLMDEGSEQVPVLHMIDLHRAQIRDRVPTRWLIKDLAGLLFSSFDKALTRRDLLRFLAAYKGQTIRDVLETEARTLARIRRRAEKLYLQDHAVLPEKVQQLLAVK